MARVLGIDIDEKVVRATLVRTGFRTVEILGYFEAPIIEQAPMVTPPAPILSASATAPGTPPPVPAQAPLPGHEPVAVEHQDAAAPALPPRPPSLPEEDPSDESSAEAALSPRQLGIRRAVADLLLSIRPPVELTVTALDGREASLRTLEIPAGAAKRLGEVIPFELDEVLPFDIDESVVTHQVLNTDGPTMDVLAAAVPRARVARTLRELDEVGLDPVEVAVGAALYDGLGALDPRFLGGVVPIKPKKGDEAPLVQPSEKTLAIVEMRTDHTDVAFFAGGTLQLARTLSGGLADLQNGSESKLERQLRRTLGAYRAAGGTALDEVRLSGEGGLFGEQLLLWLGGIFSAPAELLALPSAPGAEVTEAPARRARFGRATALAARTSIKAEHLNLRQGEFASAAKGGFLKTNGRLVIIAAAAVLLSFLFATWVRFETLGDERAELEARLHAVTGEVFDRSTRNPRRAREMLEGGDRMRDPLPEFDAFDVLDALSASIAGDIRHDTRRLSIQIDDEAGEGTFELQGTVDSIAERDTIAATLEAHECFTEVEKGRTSPAPRNEGLNYQIEVSIRCPGAAPEAEDEDDSRRSRRGR